MTRVQIQTAGLDEFLDGGSGKLQVLLYGDPGTGKTPWAAQWPDTLHIMCDRNGENSLVLTGSRFVKVRSRADMKAALDAAAMAVANGSVKTIVIDTISVYAKHVSQEILKTNNIASMDDFRQWGELTAEIVNTLHRLQNMPVNVIVLCHTKTKFDSKTFEIEPDLAGGAKLDLPKEFPYIGLLSMDFAITQVDGKDVRSTVRKIQWRGTPQISHLRSPSNILPEFTSVEFKESDYTQIRDAIEKGAQQLAARAGVKKETTSETVETSSDAMTVAAAAAPVSGAVSPDANKLPAPRKGATARTGTAAKVAAADAAAATPAPAAEPTMEEAVAQAAQEAEAAEGQAAAHAEEPTHEEAVATVTNVLEGEVVKTTTEDDIAALIEAATLPAQMTDIWREHKNMWTPALSERAKARKAVLLQG